MSVVDGSILNMTPGDLTKMRIVIAFDELLENRPYGDIGVRDIAERAGISRQTFYNHFNSKDSVDEWYWHEFASQHLLRVGRDLTWMESLTANMRLVEESLRFSLVSAARCSSPLSIGEKGFRARSENLRETITEHLGIELTDDLEFQIEFFCKAESYLVAKAMIKNNFDGIRIARLLDACVPRDLHDLLDNAVRTKREKAEL